ncbi:MAG: bifunctional DNA-formamidopyrimidine glycosylase/DNA-(apurinic or apyrimidinic site) lyase [Pseudomonadales bacterium]
MPELPEVETTRAGIEPHLLDCTIARVTIRENRLRWPISPELTQMATGQTIVSVERRAKYLLIGLARGFVMIHLGMSGSLRILPAQTAPQKHDHVDIILNSGITLRYRDPRRFGSIFWLDQLKHRLLDQLGPEPLSADFDGETLFEAAKGKLRNVKTLIMDAEVVVGVGNIYANEALYLAGIRPTRPAGKISRKRYARLAAAIKSVLEKAIDAGGTSLRDFLKEDGKPGYFRHELKVYDRAGEPCYGCNKPLSAVRITGRATVFCMRCQR